MKLKALKNKSFKGHFTLHRCTYADVRGGILPTILKVNVNVYK